MDRSRKLQVRNDKVRTHLRISTAMLKKKKASGESLTETDLSTVYRAIDKAYKIGLIKRNTAARKKSRAAKVVAS